MRGQAISNFLLAAACALPQVLGQDTGTFDFLTFNVAGLPAFLNDNGVPGDKKTNAGLIGTQLGAQGYDIVHLQEDFNYHAYIYAKDTHAHRTSTSGGVPFGSGLNTVSNYEWSKFTRTKWKQCYINEADCLTPKGFTFMRIKIGTAEVDLYNLHADAGSQQGDIDARSAGIDQILEHIKSNSDDKPIIIAGDTNDRWTNAKRSIDKLTSAGFEDVWVKLIRNGEYPKAGTEAASCGTPAANNDCEIVDKVLYRSGGSIELEPLSFSYEPDVFKQPDGNILSDHNPIHVLFSWTTK